MESNWVWNRYGSGFSLSSVELFACLPDELFGHPSAIAKLGGDPIQGVVYLRGSEAWEPFISFEPSEPNLHFPFGFPANHNAVVLF